VCKKWSLHLADGQYGLHEEAVRVRDPFAVLEVLAVYKLSGAPLPEWALEALLDMWVEWAPTKSAEKGGRRANPVEDLRLLAADDRRHELVSLARIAQGEPPESLRERCCSREEAVERIAEEIRFAKQDAALLGTLGSSMADACELVSVLARGTIYQGTARQIERSFRRVEKIRLGKSPERSLHVRAVSVVQAFPGLISARPVLKRQKRERG
jgi:hypothetical protein